MQTHLTQVGEPFPFPSVPGCLFLRAPDGHFLDPSVSTILLSVFGSGFHILWLFASQRHQTSPSCLESREERLGSVKNGRQGARSVKRPTSGRVRIAQFMGSCPVLGSVLTAQSLEPALLWILCLPLSLPLPDSHSVSLFLSLSLSKINIKKK